MSNETSIAFDTLDERVAHMSGTPPLDRIAVRDYTKEVEIGAFQSERGVRQGIQINVVVEVSDSNGAQSDDVDQILSYDAITEAIEDQLAFERLNLLETLAERIGDQILTHDRAQRVFVRIEKLDRIPGTLGVEIVRTRTDRDALSVSAVTPMVIFMPNVVLHGPNLEAWLDAIERHDAPAIVCVEQARETQPSVDNVPAQNRIDLLSIEQNAWVLGAKDTRCVVVDSRTELDWAIKNDQLSIWAPSKMVMDAVKKPEIGGDDPLGLTQWFASEFATPQICVLSGYSGASTSKRIRVVNRAREL